VLPLDNDVRLSFWRWNVVLCSQAKSRLRSILFSLLFACYFLLRPAVRRYIARSPFSCGQSWWAYCCRCLCMGIRPLLIRPSRHRTYDLKKRTQPASHLASSKLHASYHPTAAVTDVFSYFRYVSNISSYNITLRYTVLLQKCNKSTQKPNGRLMLVMSGRNTDHRLFWLRIFMVFLSTPRIKLLCLSPLRFSIKCYGRRNMRTNMVSLCCVHFLYWR
jgi:hypothetical protein